MPTSTAPARDTLVACLCAAWCGSCRDYAGTFEKLGLQLQAEHPGLRFVWVDIEDESELVDPVEVENFPTLLIATGGEPLILGPLTPQAETLLRLVRAHLAPDAGPGLQDADARALVARLRARHG